MWSGLIIVEAYILRKPLSHYSSIGVDHPSRWKNVESCARWFHKESWFREGFLLVYIRIWSLSCCCAHLEGWGREWVPNSIYEHRLARPWMKLSSNGCFVFYSILTCNYQGTAVPRALGWMKGPAIYRKSGLFHPLSCLVRPASWMNVVKRDPTCFVASRPG